MGNVDIGEGVFHRRRFGDAIALMGQRFARKAAHGRAVVDDQDMRRTTAVLAGLERRDDVLEHRRGKRLAQHMIGADAARIAQGLLDRLTTGTGGHQHDRCRLGQFAELVEMQQCIVLADEHVEEQRLDTDHFQGIERFADIVAVHRRPAEMFDHP